MARDYDGDVEIIGVPSRDDEEAMTEFVERHDLGHVRHAVDQDQQVWGAFGVPGQPAWVFVDGETGEATRRFGALSPEELVAVLDELEAGGG